MSPGTKTVLWWGRFDPDYSRNRILRALLPELGWRIVDFHPALSGIADLEAWLRRLPRPDLVWVPCFRQRDYAAARRWSRARSVPLLFDPLISAYDKQVFERERVTPDSLSARRLLARERNLFQSADRIIADTPAYADFFAGTLGVSRDRLSVVYVGAEEPLFSSGAGVAQAQAGPFEVLFYGSFIPLHGAEIIAAAARLYQGPPVHWRFIGKGPSRARCEALVRGLENVTFENWVAYPELPARIHRADVVLGIFGTTPKAGRVIPNKVYQALACARPVITRRAETAYPDAVNASETGGLIWVETGDAAELARTVAKWANNRDALSNLGRAAKDTYKQYFSAAQVGTMLKQAMERSLKPLGSRGT